MATTLRIAALQLRAHDRAQFEQATPQLLEQIDAAAAGHDLLVVPECTLPAYVLGDRNVDVSAALGRVCEIAKANHCTIVIGAAMASGNGLSNGAVVIDRDGTVAGTAQKIFLWHFDRKWFEPGNDIAPIETSIGRLGVMICADGRMPGIARELVDQGAELLVMPTAWVTSGRDPNALENIQADLLARVRAFENGVPFVAANKCGTEESMVAYCGKSQIVGADGELVALASQDAEEVISATLEIGSTTPHRTSIRVPSPREWLKRNIRVAITPNPLPSDIERRLSILDADVAVAAGGQQSSPLDTLVPNVCLTPEMLYDPGVLIPYRMNGYRCAIVAGNEPHPWLERVARARALELRIYVIVIDGNRRAYAVDPDGIIVAGTFGDFRIASFALDAGKTEQTAVAPGTDIAEGLTRVTAMVRTGSHA